MDAEAYVRACSLWVQRPGEQAVCLKPGGELTLEKLAAPRRGGFDAVYYLRFTDPQGGGTPVPREERVRLEPHEAGFKAGYGRLARVGYVSRLADALFSVSLLARGRVPGETAAAARAAYGEIMSRDEHYRYHGRVVREAGWTVLQYWFLYAFNDWRSGFYGANDHEADWEKAFVYLSERPDGQLVPEWVAYSSHNYAGDMLRRRWDDPELVKVGEHPVVHVCAGSHSNQFAAGEYLTELDLPFPAPVARLAGAVRSFWRKTLRQYGGEGGPDDEDSAGVLRIPFVDYARGDGLSIGPGGDKEWSPPRMIDPPPPWVSEYRGLWGLYTRDPFEGEDAPAGPMYDRTGSVARPWYDPVGWAGLDKVSPSGEEPRVVAARREATEERRGVMIGEIEDGHRELEGLGVEAEAMRGQPHLRSQYEEHERRIGELSEKVDRLRADLAADEALAEALDDHAARLRSGEKGSPRAHLSRAQKPVSELKLRASRLAEAWAAVSVGLTLVGLVLLVVYAREYLIFALVASIAVFLFIEAGFRGRLVNLVSSTTVGLAVVSALIILYEFFWQLVITGVVLLGLYILWDNLRELRR